jgi:hypothetical protein
VSAARSHLAALASAPRPAGGEAERRARDYCARTLRAAGFEVSEHPFGYSTFPGMWGTPIAGVLAAMMFAASGYAGARGDARSAMEILIAGAALLGAMAWWLGRWGVLDLPFARATSTNLAATRGAPTLWLVAHLDSKSQPVPIGVRAAAISALMVLWVVAAGLALSQLAGALPSWLWIPVASLGMLASIPVAATLVGARSPGALDDASGVATVLRVAELLGPETEIGVLLTSGEELGLAGARAWARKSAPGMAINVDGVDDTGALRLIVSRSPQRALLAMLGAPAWPAPVRLLPGVLMDGVALSDAGWDVVNVSKGSWRTVSRIHTPRDDLARLEGSGVEEVATMLVGAIATGRH